ncbi:hypothetical protein GCM10018954_049570 [Kutzneria kofuensis]
MGDGVRVGEVGAGLGQPGDVRGVGTADDLALGVVLVDDDEDVVRAGTLPAAAAVAGADRPAARTAAIRASGENRDIESSSGRFPGER